MSKLLLASITFVCLAVLSNSSGIASTHPRSAEVIADAGHGGSQSHGKTLEIPPGQPIPSVDLIVHPDPMKGWNLEVKVSNFRFSPERASTADKSGEGHAHLYINGEKITRLYSSWYYLEKLKPGKNEITVRLNANSHEGLVYKGKMIEDSEMLEVKASQ